MKVSKFFSVSLFVFVFVFISCQSDQPFEDTVGGWNIPEDQIFFGGVSRDGIPSLFDPKTVPASQANYLSDETLVIGIVVDGQATAYPYAILDWHEVVNETFSGNELVTISYCPLTGTAIVFDGNNAGLSLTFGVSGLLFNNNLIMFDRQTESNWPQMRLQSDQGALKDTRQKVIPSIETSWGTWKKLFPNTVVLSTDTGHDRPYNIPGSAYPGYTNLNSKVLFPVTFNDSRLPTKQRVHGVMFGEAPDNYKTKVYLIDLAQETRLINDVVEDNPILVVDSGKDNFVISYLRDVNGQTLTFRLDEDIAEFPFTFKDDETGSTWNVFGDAIDGPLTGLKLERTSSYNAYWFAWGAFFRGAEIHGQ